MLEGVAVEALHNDKRLTIVLVDVVNDAEIGVIQGGGGVRLASEAFQSLWATEERFRQELQSDQSRKLRILGFVDHTHTTTAKLLKDAVVGDGLPDERINTRHSC